MFLRLGLTGGIASGKSAAASVFRELGLGVIDADRAARDAVAPGTEGLRLVREAFGDEVAPPDGELDREAMRRRVFADASARLALEAIVHPRVYLAVMEAFRDFEARGLPAGVVEAALLLESPAPFDLDALIAVVCGKTAQRKRLKDRDGWTRREIDGVLAAQIDDAERRRRVDYVIENKGTLEELRAGVIGLWKILKS